MLKGIDIDVNEHEVVCLIGAVGFAASRRCCAASTCSRRSTEAGSRINGDRITDTGVDVDEVRREVGIVFQSFNLFPHMT